MNRVYRVVWNPALDILQPVSENARSRGKGGRGRHALADARIIAGALIMTLASGAALADGAGGQGIEAVTGPGCGAGTGASSFGKGGGGGYLAGGRAGMAGTLAGTGGAGGGNSHASDSTNTAAGDGAAGA